MITALHKPLQAVLYVLFFFNDLYQQLTLYIHVDNEFFLIIKLTKRRA